MKQAIQTISLALLLLSLIVIQMRCSSSKAKKEAVTPTPSLTSVEPVNGIVGDPVEVTGTNLQNADAITFNGTSSKIVQATNTSVISVVPAGVIAGVNNITVHTTGGNSNQLEFQVIKDPVVVDPSPPTLSKVLPAANYTDYPVLIYGNNVSGTLTVTFNDKDAIIYTNNHRVITTTVPKNLPSGVVTIKVRTTKGTSTISFQTLGPPPAPANINWNIVTIPPPNYIPSISNQWSCGLFNNLGATNGSFVDIGSESPAGSGNYTITGRYEYNFNKASNYNTYNYVEITNHITKEIRAGQFSSQYSNPCTLKMVLISSKDGRIDTCIFDRTQGDPSFKCNDQ